MIDKNLYLEKRKRSYTLVGLSLIAYFLITNLLGYFTSSWTKDMGLIMILPTFIGVLFINAIMKDISLKDIFSFEKERFKWRDAFFFLGIGLGFNMLFGLLVNFITEYFSISVPDVGEIIQESLSFTTLLYVMILGPIVEEIVYRGFVIHSLKKYSLRGAWILSSILFALMHHNFVQSLSLIGFSLVLGYLGLFYSFKLALVVHIMNNSFVMLMSNLNPEGLALQAISFLALVLIVNSIWTLISKKSLRLKAKNNLKEGPVERINEKKAYRNWAVLLLLTMDLLLIFLDIIK